MGGIFGGRSESKSNSYSGNLNNSLITGATQGSLGNIQTAGDLMKAFLSGDSTGFDAFKRMTGYDAAQEAGSRGVTSNLAAKGALNSGAAGKNYLRVANDISNQSSDDYWQRLLGLNQQGISAGSLASSAGQYSKSNSTSHGEGKSGLGNALSFGAQLLSMSDPRLKRNIVRIGETPEGIPTYEYEYLWDDVKRVGVMADEVAKIKPEALGPTIAGYRSVDYSKLEV